MQYRLLLVAFVLSSFALFAQAEDKAVVRVLNLKDVKLKSEGKSPTPIIIESAEELAKAKVFADDASREAIKKQIDFTKEKLVVAAWTGSGDTKFTAMVAPDKKELTVRLITDVGVTKDLKEQSYAAAIPKDAKTLNAVR